VLTLDRIQKTKCIRPINLKYKLADTILRTRVNEHFYSPQKDKPINRETDIIIIRINQHMGSKISKTSW